MKDGETKKLNDGSVSISLDRDELDPDGRAQLPGREEDRVRKFRGVAARQEHVHQRACGHQAGADEVQGTPTTLGISVHIYVAPT